MNRIQSTGLLFEELAREPSANAPPAPRHVGIYVEVALNRPIASEFTYAVPAELAQRIAPGMRVAVPFGPRREVGVVVRLSCETPLASGRVKPVAKLLDEEPLLDAHMLELTRWMATRWAGTWGEALAAVLPNALKREGAALQVVMIRTAPMIDPVRIAELETKRPKQHRMLRTLLEIGGEIELRELCRRMQLGESVAKNLARDGFALIERKTSRNDPLATSSVPRARPEKLSADQETARARIVESLRSGKPATFLLQGVTGSGKTEVYLRVIEDALAEDKGAIVMVPEIALTPQTVGWFRSRFGDVAVLHSRMTDAQRRSMWLSVKHGRARVVVGARSAVFAPVHNLGVIVVDEEHEPSFKQESTPRYHARDVAEERARMLGATCILGSATPSLESWQRARESKIERLLLRERVSGGRLPKVEILDLRGERSDGGGPPLFSRRLRELLTGALARGEQSILFQNRRGFTPTLWCQACGECVRCAQCDSNLTFHRRIRRLVCHSCCEEIPVPQACPTCTAPGLRHLGAGSERIEELLRQLLPAARVERMDSDTMVRREDYERTLERFGRGEIDVLVGTQMIAKGLDFPRVTVVGVISADTALYLPDFRASERTFQLLAQVAGRAGRGVLAGQIVVQTTTPGHPAILCAARHDFEGFAAAECKLRAELGYPPYGRIVRAVFEDKDLAKASDTARACAERLRKSLPAEAIVLGPAEAPIALVRGRHRQHLLVKIPRESAALDVARAELIAFAAEQGRMRIAIDVDPMAML